MKMPVVMVALYGLCVSFPGIAGDCDQLSELETTSLDDPEQIRECLVDLLNQEKIVARDL